MEEKENINMVEENKSNNEINTEIKKDSEIKKENTDNNTKSNNEDKNKLSYFFDSISVSLFSIGCFIIGCVGFEIMDNISAIIGLICGGVVILVAIVFFILAIIKNKG